MTDQRERLLELLEVGYELEAAAREARLSLAEIRADPDLLAIASDAFRLGTSRIRSKLLERALSASGDTHVLERAIAGREQAWRDTFRVDAQAAGGVALEQLSDQQLELLEAVTLADWPRVASLVAALAPAQAAAAPALPAPAPRMVRTRCQATP